MQTGMFPGFCGFHQAYLISRVLARAEGGNNLYTKLVDGDEVILCECPEECCGIKEGDYLICSDVEGHSHMDAAEFALRYVHYSGYTYMRLREPLEPPKAKQTKKTTKKKATKKKSS